MDVNIVMLITIPKTVRQNYALHDPKSPFLIGNLKADDKIHQADQKSWIDGQLVLKFD